LATLRTHKATKMNIAESLNVIIQIERQLETRLEFEVVEIAMIQNGTNTTSHFYQPKKHYERDRQYDTFL
jgi:hypothetical protein